MRENKLEKEKKATFQGIVYFIGLLFVVLTGVQFFTASQTQISISSYESRLNSANIMRDDLIRISDSYNEAFTKILSTSKVVNDQLNAGLITEQEANITIRGLYLEHTKPLSIIMGRLLIWDTTYPPSGGFIANPEFSWLFTEDIIWVAWLPRFYNEIAIVDPRYATWININWSVNFPDFYTREILSENRWSNTYLNYTDDSLNWFYMDIYITEFDNYIDNTVINPLNNLESQLVSIQIGITATTIGIILIGFLVDFSSLRKGWRVVYVFFTAGALALSFIITLMAYL